MVQVRIIQVGAVAVVVVVTVVVVVDQLQVMTQVGAEYILQVVEEVVALLE